MSYRLKYEITGIEGLSKRELAAIFRGAMEDVATRWHAKYLPLKFKNSATQRYGLEPRKGERGSDVKWWGSYTQRKLKKYGHTRPFEFTGASRRAALSRVNMKATATSRRMAVDVFLPTSFNLRAAGSQVNMAEEIRRVIPSEIRDLDNYLVNRIERRYSGSGRQIRSSNYRRAA